jgi:hypothetical protein
LGIFAFFCWGVVWSVAVGGLPPVSAPAHAAGVAGAGPAHASSTSAVRFTPAVTDVKARGDANGEDAWIESTCATPMLLGMQGDGHIQCGWCPASSWSRTDGHTGGCGVRTIPARGDGVRDRSRLSSSLASSRIAEGGLRKRGSGVRRACPCFLGLSERDTALELARHPDDRRGTRGRGLCIGVRRPFDCAYTGVGALGQLPEAAPQADGPRRAGVRLLSKNVVVVASGTGEGTILVTLGR